MKDDAVSSVVSEMLLIALVLILVPSVTITLMNQLPGDRVPTVNIKMGSIEGGTVTLYHKGGDYLIWRDLLIKVNDNFIDPPYSKNTLDLGDSFSLPVKKGDVIQLIVKNSVIFSGVV